MPKTDTTVPESITRYTTQLDTVLYRKITALSSAAEVKHYVLINKMLLVGAQQVLKDYNEKFGREKEMSFNTSDLSELKSFLKDKGF